jgi:hypothetical protein
MTRAVLWPPNLVKLHTSVLLSCQGLAALSREIPGPCWKLDAGLFGRLWHLLLFSSYPWI